MTRKELSAMAKFLFPFYMEYRKEGHGQDRAMNKASINYEECHNVTIDDAVYNLMYEVMMEAEMTL